jgi:cell division initiation protein
MLEPEKIRSKRFATVKNGCNPAEVSSFLAEIADEIAALQSANADSEEKIVKLVEKINQYREDEEAIKSAMVYAQKESNKLINDAKAKARDMIESAKTEQVRLSEQSAAECEKIIEEHKAKCAELIQQQTESTQAEIVAIQQEYDDEKAALDDLRAQVTYFKSQLTELYTKQLALIMDIPQMDSDELAEYEEGYDEYADDEYDEYDEEYDYDEEYEDEYEEPAEDEKTAEQKHIDEVLNTASFEPIIPKPDSADLLFGKNTK